jgi:general stress protein YciG
MSVNHPKAYRGFAAMSPEKQRAIASKGGRAAHVKGAAHEWTADEARLAGHKGGCARRDRHDEALAVPARPDTPVTPERRSEA